MAMGGASLLMKFRHYSLFFSQTYILLPVVFTFCSAVFLIGTGFLGTWLSLKDSRCLQGLVRLSLTSLWVNVCIREICLHVLKDFLLQFVYLLVVIFCVGSTACALASVQSRKVPHHHKCWCFLIILEKKILFFLSLLTFSFSWTLKQCHSARCLRITQAAVRT